MALIVQSHSSPTTGFSHKSTSPNPRLISASIPSYLNQISANEERSSENELVVKKPKCCRKLIDRFEKAERENEIDAKEHIRSNLSVFKRLADHKPPKRTFYDDNLTFCPKLNPLSVRLAQERSEKLEEVQSRAASIAASRVAKMYADYTFKPVVSNRSLQLAQNLGIGFLTRQQEHIKKRQKLIEESELLLRTTNNTSKPRITKQPHPSNLPKCLPSTNSPCSPLTGPRDSGQIPKLVKETIVSPQKRTRIRKHIRSSTVPVMAVRKTPVKSSDQMCLEHQMSVLLTPKAIPKSSLIKDKRKCSPAGANSVEKDRRTEGLLEKDFKSLNEFDRVKRIKVMAEKISRAKKIFMVKGGYKTVRKALRSRGWVEVDYYTKAAANGATNTASPYAKDTRLQQLTREGKSQLGRKETNQADGDDDDDDIDDVDDIEESESEEEKEDEEEYTMLSRALRNNDPYFIWSLRKNEFSTSYLKKEQMFNHFSKAWFTTKCGLCSSLRTLSSFAPVDHHSFFPRCYELTSEEDKAVFIDDYRLTTAMNIIKIVACEINSTFADLYQPSDKWALPRVNITSSAPHTLSSSPNPHLSSSPSQLSLSAPTTPVKHSASTRTRPQTSSSLRNIQIVPEECVLLALKACDGFIRSKENNDIDQSQIDLCPGLSEDDWDTLISYYYSLVFSDGILFCTSDTAMRAEELLEQLAVYQPQLSMDGFRNMWIVKPGALSRGRGIVCMDHLEDILSFIKPSVILPRQGQWVVQKYIERPLLIHDTKFDIRQWFLVTDWNPLTMWMYKTCYLRFSSQIYSSRNLDKSIHLCNNSIQKHMTNSEMRNSELPEENMWDSDTFKSYLRECGLGDKWERVIYPGMVEAIKHVLLVSQDNIEDRKNTFELYGADFMITTDYNPWLIEINCSPTMERNTTVTKRLCKEVMEDTIKVVIDRRSNRNADTGNFELAYKQTKLDVPQYVGVQLYVEGRSVESKRLQTHSKPRTQTVPAVDLGALFNFTNLK